MSLHYQSTMFKKIDSFHIPRFPSIMSFGKTSFPFVVAIK